MGTFSLHLMYLTLHRMMSIFFLSLAQFVHMHVVSHGSGWHAHAYSVCNNFSLYKREYSL